VIDLAMSMALANEVILVGFGKSAVSNSVEDGTGGVWTPRYETKCELVEMPSVINIGTRRSGPEKSVYVIAPEDTAVHV
jgi:hypothetical protein